MQRKITTFCILSVGAKLPLTDDVADAPLPRSEVGLAKGDVFVPAPPPRADASLVGDPPAVIRVVGSPTVSAPVMVTVMPDNSVRVAVVCPFVCPAVANPVVELTTTVNVTLEEEGGAAVSLASNHVLTTHCAANALSARAFPCLVGVRLSRYDVLKLPAAHTTSPINTSELALMKAFCAQKAVRHDAALDAPVSLTIPLRPFWRR